MIFWQRSGAAPLARVSNEQRERSTWRLCPHENRTPQCPHWSVTRQTLQATSPRVPPWKVPGRVPFPGPLLGTMGDPPVGPAPFGNVGLPSFLATPLPPRNWLSAIPSPNSPVRVPPGSVALPPPLSQPFLLGSFPLPPRPLPSPGPKTGPVSCSGPGSSPAARGGLSPATDCS